MRQTTNESFPFPISSTSDSAHLDESGDVLSDIVRQGAIRMLAEDLVRIRLRN